jgi:predicted DNA binding CopG/RHH family protein
MVVSASLVLDTGEKEGKYMSNNIKYTDAPLDIAQALQSAVPIEDFLPSPDQLILKEEKEKITIAINKRSLELFKSYAGKHNAKYQTMINDVVSSYADKFLVK